MTGTLLRTPAEEPPVARWAPRRLDDLAATIAEAAGASGAPVGVVAVDGRSGSGKSTLAEALAHRIADAVVVHTDDVAWWESFFGWDELMISGILAPLRAGASVSYRPPAWAERGRPGAIEVGDGTRLVIVEGVGASRRSLSPYLAASVWVQSDLDEARRRGVARDVLAGRTHDEAEEFWDAWMAEEGPFLAGDRPWERAGVIACGTPSLLPVAFDAAAEVLCAVPAPVTRA